MTGTVNETVATSGSTAGPLIAHVIFRLDYGGLENGLVNLVNRIPDTRYRHAVVCLTDYSDFRERLRPGVEVHAVHKRAGKDLPVYGRLWSVFRRLRPDIVHTRNLAPLDAHLPAWAAGVRGHVHGEHGYDIHDIDGSSRKYRLLRRLVSPFVQRFIPLSRDLERYLVDAVGVPSSKVRRICNGVDAERFAPVAQRLPLPDTQFAEDDIVIGSVGRMEVVKDPLNLVRAFVTLLERRPGLRQRLRLVHIGDGSLREAAQNLLAEAGLADRAWLPGTRGDVPEMLKGLDVFVLPSRNEGISNTILEAMACALPVVATDVGGNAELVEDGRTGAIVPPGDADALASAIEAYVSDAQRRREHGRRARERIEQQFSMQAMVANYLHVYDDVCARAAHH